MSIHTFIVSLFITGWVCFSLLYLIDAAIQRKILDSVTNEHIEDVQNMILYNQYMEFEAWKIGEREGAELRYSGPSKADPTRDTTIVLHVFNRNDNGIYYTVD